MKFEQRKLQEDITSNVPRSLNRYTTHKNSDLSSNALVSVESGQMDEQIKSMMTRKMAADSQTFLAWTCNVCGKEDRYKSHIE